MMRKMSPRKNSERLAWIILSIAFVVFCFLVVSIPFGIRWYIINATQVHKTSLAAIGGTVGGVLAYVIYAVGGSDSNNTSLCLVAGAVGRIVAWTITEAIIGLTLAQLVRTRPPTTLDRT